MKQVQEYGDQNWLQQISTKKESLNFSYTFDPFFSAVNLEKAEVIIWHVYDVEIKDLGSDNSDSTDPLSVQGDRKWIVGEFVDLL